MGAWISGRGVAAGVVALLVAGCAAEGPVGGPVVPTDGDGWAVVEVIDGDTIDVTDGRRTERVRIAGIDAPERGECGFDAATSVMLALVEGRTVDLVHGSRDDRDHYGRLVRYVDVAGADTGLALIAAGLAVARYDSRDGYGEHDREAHYVATDEATPHLCDGAGSDGDPGSGIGVGPS